MKLRARHAARAPGLGDRLPAPHALPALDQQRLVVRIGRHPAIVVLDQHQIAEAADFIARIDDDAAIRRDHRFAGPRRDIDAVIVEAVLLGAKPGNDLAPNGPEKSPIPSTFWRLRRCLARRRQGRKLGPSRNRRRRRLDGCRAAAGEFAGGGAAFASLPDGGGSGDAGVEPEATWGDNVGGGGNWVTVMPPGEVEGEVVEVRGCGPLAGMPPLGGRVSTFRISPGEAGCAAGGSAVTRPGMISVSPVRIL